MERLLAFVSLISLLIVVVSHAKAESIDTEQSALVTIDFEGMEAGASPTGFAVTLTGTGSRAIWTVEERLIGAQTSKVLIQASVGETKNRFPLCVYEGFSAKNLELSVRFLPLSGRVDQAAGLVWRYQDKNNYYVVRANALEDNVVLYKMDNGKRSDLKPVGAGVFSYGAKAPVPANQWGTLGVVITDERFAVYLNGEHLFDVEDKTFQNAGKVGLWTKADSITAFDNLAIKSTDPA